MKRSRRPRRKKCNTARKVCYPTREDAERAGKTLVLLGKWFGKKAYAYPCESCGQWHITKMKQPERGEE